MINIDSDTGLHLYEKCPISEIKKIKPLWNYIIEKEKKNKTIYKIDKVESCFYDIMYNLIRQKRKWINHWNKPEYQRKEKLKPNSGIRIPQRQKTYSEKNNTSFSNLIKSLDYTYHRIKLIIDILKKYNIIKYKSGWFNHDSLQGQVTQITIKEMIDWKIKPNTFSEWLEIFCNIISIRTGDSKNVETKIRNKKNVYRAVIVDKDKNYKGEIYEKKKDKRKKYDYWVEPASKHLQDEVDFFNKHLPSYLSYNRIFYKNEYECGRFQSVLHRIPRELRHKGLKIYKYKEVDFSSFNINLLYFFNTGKKYEGDIYIDIIKNLNIDSDLIDSLRPIMKEMTLTLYGSGWRNKARNEIEKKLSSIGINYTKFETPEMEHKRFELWYKYLKEYELDIIDYKPTGIKSLEILDAAEETCTGIKDILYLYWNRFCQFIESEIIKDLMYNMIENGLIPYSVHDCVIVPEKEYEYYNNLKEDILIKKVTEYQEYFDNLKLEKRYEKIEKAMFKVKEISIFQDTVYWNDLIEEINGYFKNEVIENIDIKRMIKNIIKMRSIKTLMKTNYKDYNTMRRLYPNKIPPADNNVTEMINNPIWINRLVTDILKEDGKISKSELELITDLDHSIFLKKDKVEVV